MQSWVRQADVNDGLTVGVTSDGAAEIRGLDQENRERYIEADREFLWG